MKRITDVPNITLKTAAFRHNVVFEKFWEKQKHRLSDPVHLVLDEMLHHEAEHLAFNGAVLALVVAHDVCILAADCDTGKDLALNFGPKVDDIRLVVTLALGDSYRIDYFLFDDFCDRVKLLLKECRRKNFSRRRVVLVEGVHKEDVFARHFVCDRTFKW